MNEIKLKDFAITPAQAKQQAAEIVAAVKAGELDALQIYLRAYAMQKAADEILKGTSDNAVEYLSRYGGEMIVGDMKLKECETGVRYDYTCSSEWVERNNQIKALQDAQKALEMRIKSATPASPFFDAHGVQVDGATKTSKTSIKIV